MNPLFEYQLQQTRRQFFGDLGLRCGSLALATLAGGMTRSAPAAAATAVHPPLPGLPHFEPRARALIYLHMNGAPSQFETFDYKPKLHDLFDTELPASVRMGQRITTMTSGQARFPVAPSIFKFRQHGQSGAWISELLPHISSVADDIAIVRTVNTDAINHDPACTFVFSGAQQPGRPSMGAWVSYGLGSANRRFASSHQGNSSPGSSFRSGATSEWPTTLPRPIPWRSLMSARSGISEAICSSGKGRYPNSWPGLTISMPTLAELTSVTPRQRDLPECQARFSSSTNR